MSNNNSDNSVDLVKLLYKIVIQYGIYTQKSNKNLDNYISGITHALKKGGDFHRLMPDLVAMSKTLSHLIQAKQLATINPSIIEYLMYRVGINADDRLNQVVHGLETQEIKSNEQLFTELDRVFFNAIAPVDSEKGGHHQKQLLFINRLAPLLADSNIPPKYKRQYSVLKKCIDNGNAGVDGYDETIEKVISFLLKIINHAQIEQQNIKGILTKMCDELILIEEKTEQVTVENQHSIENRTEFNQELNIQVNHLLENTHKASELADLQHSLSQLLAQMSVKIETQQLSEELLHTSVQQQLLDVTEKLQATEAEANSLRNELELAYNLALQDALTGLANRLAYDQRIDYENKRWRRIRHPLSLIVWDIDHFKKINDIYGHKSGDKTLVSITQLIIQNCRQGDFVARYGGEEFVMLLPNTYAEQAFVLADKIRHLISNANFNANNETVQITVSAGIHQFVVSDTCESAFEQADKALYTAKMNGRNQCKISDDLTTLNHLE